MAGNRGKNFTQHEDLQICKSWIRIRNKTGTNGWDALYQDAISREKAIKQRTANGVRLRFRIIFGSVQKFLDCLQEVQQQQQQHQVDEPEAFAEAKVLYRTKYRGEFKFAHCWKVLKDSNAGSAEKLSVSDDGASSDDEDSQAIPRKRPRSDIDGDEQNYSNDYSAERISPSIDKESSNHDSSSHALVEAKIRGKNFSQNEDVQICKSWIATQNESGANRWEALYQDAISREEALKLRNTNGVRCRFVKISQSIDKFLDCMKEFQHQPGSDSEALEEATKLYRTAYGEEFKFVPCWMVLKDSTFSSSRKSMTGTDDKVADDTSHEVVRNRGKNFSQSEDLQICNSWITTQNVTGANRWEVLYQDAINKEEALKQRNTNGVRCRFFSISRSVENFVNCLKDVQQRQQVEESEALQQAMQLYGTTYGEQFKYAQCWEVLKDTHFERSVKSSIGTDKKETDDAGLSSDDETPQTVTRQGSRNINVRPDEIQALLKACLELGVEDVRRAGERYEYLFCDVQQQMATYGGFPERKLYMLKKYYLRTEREFLNGLLVPYPPEARILWGSSEHDADATANDKAWEQLADAASRRRSPSSLTILEITELIKLALAKKVESAPQTKQRDLFEEIFETLYSKGLRTCKNSSQLYQDYLNLKQRFLSGVDKNLPFQASLLWGVQNVDGDDDLQLEDNFNQSFEFVEHEIKIEVGKCRICSGELGEHFKDLFEDAFEGQTYGKIIQDTINVVMMQDCTSNSKICNNCSLYIESLNVFVNRCRASCDIGNVKLSSEDKFKIDIERLDSPTSVTSDLNALDDQFKDEVDELCDEKQENSDFINEDNNENDPVEPTEQLSHVLTEDPSNAPIMTEDARKAEKFRKFTRSRPSRCGPRGEKRQCHLCGKRVIDLAVHIESHGGLSLQCEICGHKTTNRRQLKVHMNLHTREKKYPCRYCDKVFYVWASRKCHEEQHLYKSFTCEQCGAEYKNRNYLEFHIKRIHLGRRHLKCKQCSFTTFLTCRLRNHVRSIHTSERPYQCTMCEHTANSNTGYYIHFKRHIKSGDATEYTIKCAYCAEPFTKDAALEKHIVKDHPDRAVLV